MTGRVDDALGRLATQQHGIFALEHVDALGFSDGARKTRTSSGRWVPVYEGVYRMGGAPRTWRGDLLAACLAAGPDALASHFSAAALWSLPAGRTDVSELTCPRWKRSRHVRLVVHESLAIGEEDRDERDRVPCTSAARTLFDLARTLRPVMLDANIDTALRRRLVSLDDLRRTSTRLATKGRPGGRRFRAAVEARTGVSTLPESVPERLLADMLVRHGLPTPVHQFVVRDQVGGFVARVDLAYPDAMVVIEYDSVEHHTGTAAHYRDAARRNAISDLDYTVLVATGADVKDRANRLATSVRRHL
jgi:very-short-patch-repair endonuclease